MEMKTLTKLLLAIRGSVSHRPPCLKKEGMGLKLPANLTIIREPSTGPCMVAASRTPPGATALLAATRRGRRVASQETCQTQSISASPKT